MFGEYAENTSEGDFYFNKDAEVEAKRCSLSLTGSLRDPIANSGRCESFFPNGLPDQDCIFEDDRYDDNHQTTKGSLLYRSSLSNVS